MLQSLEDRNMALQLSLACFQNAAAVLSSFSSTWQTLNWKFTTMDNILWFHLPDDHLNNCRKCDVCCSLLMKISWVECCSHSRWPRPCLGLFLSTIPSLLASSYSFSSLMSLRWCCHPWRRPQDHPCLGTRSGQGYRLTKTAALKSAENKHKIFTTFWNW